jgi:phenylacetate-CoA ligase
VLPGAHLPEAAAVTVPPIGVSTVEGIVWPPVLTGEAALLAALIARLEETQWLSSAQIEAAQGDQLARLAAHHARHTPAFRKRLAAAGIAAAELDRIDRLGALPPMARRQLQAAGRDFFARHVPKGHLPLGQTKTSGSTGEPVTLQRTNVSRLFWAACTVRDHLWHGRDFASRMTSIRPTISAYLEMEDWGFPAAALFRTGTAQAIPSTVPIDEQLALIERFQPHSLLSFPTNLRALADRWKQAGAVPTGLRHLRTVGETVSAEFRAHLAASLGLQVEDNYSSQEAGVIALQCPEGGLYHAMAESLVVEVLGDDDAPCAEGEVGRVVLTDLHNFASPLVRYDIGDYAEVGGRCACGRALPTLKRILGRERNLLVKPDGTRHWPLVGFQRFDEVAPVQQYQVVQHALDEVELKVVTAQLLSGAEADALAAIVRQALAFAGRVRVEQSRTRLPNSRGGKFEEFVCHVRPAAAPDHRP